MAIVHTSNPEAQLWGKLGDIVYAQQRDGSVTARSVGLRTAEWTEGEKKGQHRMQLAHPYVHGVLGDPTATDRAGHSTVANTTHLI
jgi:hypothetical protein